MSEERKKFEGIRTVTPVFRASYLTVFEPKAYQQGPPKYSVEMLFDKEKTDLSEFKKKMKTLAVKAWGEDTKAWPKNFRWPFKDGDNLDEDVRQKTKEIYAGHVTCRADSQQPVGIFDQNKEDILDKREIYSGCYCRASVYMVPYENVGGKGASGRSGIKLYLQGVQLVKKGEPFGSNDMGRSDFDVVEDESGSDEDSDDMGF